MEARMHSLEDAIAIIHGNGSNSPHPLLTTTTLEDYDDEDEPVLKAVVEEKETSALSNSFGSLHIDDHGAARFFGPSGGSEVRRTSLLVTHVADCNISESVTGEDAAL